MENINERLKAAFEPTNIELFDLQNLQIKLNDIINFSKYQHISNEDFFQLSGYANILREEIKSRLAENKG